MVDAIPLFLHLAHLPYADTRKADGASHQLFLYPVLPSSTQHVRGGSVSRRGLNQLARNRTTSQAEPTPKNRPNPNASRSSGERGLGGEALLSEKRPLPPEAPSPSLRKGVRGRTLLYREAFSPAPPLEEIVMGDAGGEAASLREAPLPQTPSPEERLALGLRLFSCLVPPERWVRLR